MEKQTYKVAVYLANGNTKYKTFPTMDMAQEFQEHCVFNLGLDAEVE